MRIVEFLRSIIGRAEFGASGSKIEHLSRESVRYISPTGRTVDLDLLYGDRGERLLSERSLRAWTNGPVEPIPRTEREQIIALLELYCRRRGDSVRIVS